MSTQQLEPLDMAAWLDRPWELSAWASEIGIGPLVQSSLADHLVEVAKKLKGLSPEALAAYIVAQELQVATAAHYRPGTADRACKALKLASTTPFGGWLATSPLRHDAQLLAWVADNSKSTSNEKD